MQLMCIYGVFLHSITVSINLEHCMYLQELQNIIKSREITFPLYVSITFYQSILSFGKDIAHVYFSLLYVLGIGV